VGDDKGVDGEDGGGELWQVGIEVAKDVLKTRDNAQHHNQTDDDEEATALYLKVSDDQMFMQYHMDFTSSLDSDIDSDGYLEDLEDK